MESAYDVTVASMISFVIGGFYLSMIKRQYFPYIGAYPEWSHLLKNLVPHIDKYFTTRL